MARLAYIKGRIDVDEFECSVEHVLRGGTLRQDGRVPPRLEPTKRELETPGGTVMVHGWREVAA
jgi:hypothetical protein